MGPVSRAGVRICGASLLKSGFVRLPGAGAMREAEEDQNKRYKIWAEVSKEEKQQIREDAENAGCGQGDLIHQRVFGGHRASAAPHRRAVREIVSTCHALKQATREGRANPDQVDALTKAAIGLLADLANRGP